MAPSSVGLSVSSLTSITVLWEPVDCRHRNGEITGYSVRYGEEGSSERDRTVKIVSGDYSGGIITISGLTKETAYTVEVAAKTSAGTGVYSDPLIIESPSDHSMLQLKLFNFKFCMFTNTDVNLSLNRDFIPNHGYVNISDIGSEDDTALLCHTNRPKPLGSHSSGGDWYAPDGTRVGDKDKNNVEGFVRNRGNMVVRLKRTTGIPLHGIYNCIIDDNSNISQRVFVGLYQSGAGIYMP